MFFWKKKDKEDKEEKKSESIEAIVLQDENNSDIEDSEIQEIEPLKDMGMGIEIPIVKEEIKEEPKKEKKSFFAKLKEGLEKTTKNFTSKLDNLIGIYKKIDEAFLEELEETLITSDMGVETTMDIIEYIKEEVKKSKIDDTSEIKNMIKKYLVNLLNEHKGQAEDDTRPKAILIIGVNGVGKTTSIGKIAYRLKSSGKKVIVAAADTFRAAAVEQLKEWCTRARVEIISSENGSDPASVIYDSVQAAKARKSDVLICDTAGRLHNKKNLMNELTKIFKILDREYSEAQKEVYLVIDATTGQNGIIQAQIFKESCDITGLILTKLDGTAKGGIAFPIVKELNIPIKYVCVGEQIDDIQPFNAEDFVNAIFE